MENMTFEEMLTELSLFKVKKRKPTNILIVDFNCLVEGHREGRARLLLEVHRERTRSF